MLAYVTFLPWSAMNSVKQQGTRAGNWLTQAQVEALIKTERYLGHPPEPGRRP
jgi:hypothetical protein